MSDEYIKKEDVLKFIEDIKCNKDVPKNYGTLLDIMRYIRKMPTYDVDKVVERLKELEEWNNEKFKDSPCKFGEGYGCCIDEVLEIIKSGCVADD